jgi:hypothetical protein
MFSICSTDRQPESRSESAVALTGLPPLRSEADIASSQGEVVGARLKSEMLKITRLLSGSGCSQSNCPAPMLVDSRRSDGRLQVEPCRSFAAV